ncbi:MAG: NAD-dependent epimerase/dehydratase family protein [Bianqueaceae bacterium]
MRALCIGGTGVISSAVAELAVRRGWEVIALNRGNREVPAGVMSWQADIRQEREVAALVERESFDVVMDFIAYTREDVERDWRIFRGRAKQYILSAVHPIPLHKQITLSMTYMANPMAVLPDKIAVKTYDEPSEGFQ